MDNDKVPKLRHYYTEKIYRNIGGHAKDGYDARIKLICG
jgi:hypothetical protein